jgi:hypothetical protein
MADQSLLGLGDLEDELGELDTGEAGAEGGDGAGGDVGAGESDDAEKKAAEKRFANLEKQIKDSQSHISRVESENKELRERLEGHTKTPEQIKEEEEKKNLSDRLLGEDAVGAVEEIVNKAVEKAIAPVSERVTVSASDAIADKAIKSISRKYEFPFKDKKIMAKLRKQVEKIPVKACREDPEGAILTACKMLDDGKHLKKREAPLFEIGSGKRIPKGKTPAEIQKEAIKNATNPRRVLENINS